MDAVEAGNTQSLTGATSTGSDVGRLAYETFYGGAIGGSVIALSFLVLDMLQGRPLFTPSVIGSALFAGADPTAVAEVRLDMVAYFTVVHFAAFLVLGALASKVCEMTELAASNLLVVTGVVFVVLTAAFLGGAAWMMGGVVGVIGLPQILGVNALTAGAMAAFLAREHRAG